MKSMLVGSLVVFSSLLAAAHPPVSCTDAYGVRVTLQQPPQRIVSLAPSNTEILFALGLGSRCVGVTTMCDYPPAARDMPRMGGYGNMSIERIVALAPDLVLAHSINPKPLVERLRQAGCAVFVLDPKNLNEVPAAMLAVASLCGQASAGVRLAARFRAEIAATTAALQHVANAPRVYFGSWEAPFFTAGEGTFVSTLIEMAGGRNTCKDIRSGWFAMSLASLVEKDPEVIIHGMPGKQKDLGPEIEHLRRQPGWQGMTAVRQGRVYVVNPDLIHRTGPRLPQALRRLAQAIHPECFQKREAVEE